VVFGVDDQSNVDAEDDEKDDADGHTVDSSEKNHCKNRNFC